MNRAQINPVPFREPPTCTAVIGGFHAGVTCSRRARENIHGLNLCRQHADTWREYEAWQGVAAARERITKGTTMQAQKAAMNPQNSVTIHVDPDDDDGPCAACEAAREEGYRACSGCEDGTSKQEAWDMHCEWRRGRS